MEWRRLTMMLALFVSLGCDEHGVAAPTPEPETEPRAPLTAPERSQPMSFRVTGEERLAYVEVASRGSADGSLKRGDRVDLLMLLEAAPGQWASRMLLQNASVLDVPADDPTRVGLLLTIREYQSVALAGASGELHLLVRHPDDQIVSVNSPKTLQELLDERALLASERKKRWPTRVRTTERVPHSIAAGERALALSGLAGAGVVVAGDRVDLTGQFPDLTQDRAPGVSNYTSHLLLEDVRVLERGSEDELLLAVTHSEASMLLLARQQGTLGLLLRNFEDVETRGSMTMTSREMLEDLEVIQHERQSRSRTRKRAYKPKIELIMGDRENAHPSPRPVPTAGEGYQDHGTNPFVATREDRFSTFGADVDTGSYTNGRGKILSGSLPPAASVRVEEYVNFFSYADPAPTDGALRVTLEAAPSPFSSDGNKHLLRIGLKGRLVKESERKPVHLVFLVDVSGSMNKENRLGHVRQALRHLVRNLRPTDTVAIATYAGSSEILLEPTSRARGGEAAILAAVDRLQAGGGTAMGSGLDLAYRLADANFVADHENRVIVLSDGDANMGARGSQEMLAKISGGVKKGITLSTIGFGMGNYQDHTMEQLANNGNGNYFYVDSVEEAKRIFGDQLDGTLQTIAKDVKIQVEFNPAAVRRYRLIGYENRDIADKDFRNDEKDAGEIGAGHTVTALYEIELADALPATVATVRVRHKEPHSSAAKESSFSLTDAKIHAKLGEASDDLRFAASVAAFAEILRGSVHGTHLNLDWVAEVAQNATGSYGDRAEFVELVGAARSLMKGR